ncbi:transcriptional regulator, MarR family [Caloramator fervidus]|uniref:Transcriptional regulator, MarR family n=1 Tax=Caloramator fervidus TaxID=29344 RepID=A0A1H5XK59_9CLOT|nr:ROK family transcriptional regulator [Caloramator fervidus]SEG12112.1 transcriptional regulator, MarR family [Caloramator fervidus]
MRKNVIPGSFQLMKKINTGLVFDAIRLYAPISRAEIAKLLNLTPATVTNITAELLKRNIIMESDFGKSNGGRRPVLLKINPNSYYIISVYIGPTKVRVATINMESEIMCSKQESLYSNISFEKAKEIIVTLIREVIDSCIVEKNKILGIGVAIHGIVNFEKGIVVFSPNFGWKNIGLRDVLEKEFDIPVFIDRDVRAMAMAENWYGEGREFDDFICIKVGYGIGAAFIKDKQQIRGVSDGLGEFGHIKIKVDDLKCICGNYGCLENYASERAVIRFARENGYEDEFDIEKINLEALNGNKVIVEALKKAGYYLGLGVANLINIFNPGLIIVGGDLVDINIYFESLIESARENSLEDLFEHVKIKRAKTGKDSIIKGAGLLVLDSLFDSIEGEVIV